MPELVENHRPPLAINNEQSLMKLKKRSITRFSELGSHCQLVKPRSKFSYM